MEAAGEAPLAHHETQWQHKEGADSCHDVSNGHECGLVCLRYVVAAVFQVDAVEWAFYRSCAELIVHYKRENSVRCYDKKSDHILFMPILTSPSHHGRCWQRSRCVSSPDRRPRRNPPWWPPPSLCPCSTGTRQTYSSPPGQMPHPLLASGIAAFTKDKIIKITHISTIYSEVSVTMRPWLTEFLLVCLWTVTFVSLSMDLRRHIYAATLDLVWIQSNA